MNRAYPFVSLIKTVVMPHTTAEINVIHEEFKAAIKNAYNHHEMICLGVLRDPQIHSPELDDLYGVGVLALVKDIFNRTDNSLKVVVEATDRISIAECADSHTLEVRGEIMEDLRSPDPITVNAFTKTLKKLLGQIKTNHTEFNVDRVRVSALIDFEDPLLLGFKIADLFPWTLEEKMAILEASELEDQLSQILSLLNRDLTEVNVQKRIEKRIRDEIDQNHQEYVLRQRMKAIEQELRNLGKEITDLGDRESYLERIENAGMPQIVEQKVQSEMIKLERMQPGSAEANLVANYLDWLLDVPWSKETDDVIDIGHNQKVLNEDHYGLHEVKERILEFLAVRQLTQNQGQPHRGLILCFVGPPGVGKTSLGRSIARSMNREFVRIFLGGVSDEAEIRGHRRTYIGALPGKIIRGMKACGVKNPVFLIDEIDKLGSGWRGDPSAALLEVFDPEQNSEFEDHYLDVPYDLSQVFFIATANTLSTISRPLLDRMEVIQLTGYTPLEKINIAKQFLWSRQLAQSGMFGRLALSNEALKTIITEYTSEAGVRGLERELSKLARRSAKRFLGSPWDYKREFDEADIRGVLGTPITHGPRSEPKPQVGAAQGLAWSASGGMVITVEAVVFDGKGRLELTGNLGDTMKESARATLSYLNSHLEEWNLPRHTLSKLDIHVHVPEGGVSKDGPSAGVTIATAVASAITHRPVRMDVALTGEVTLRGKVLGIGGIKEKLLVAHQTGISYVMIPKENSFHLKDLPKEIQDEIEIICVDHVSEILDFMLLNDSQSKLKHQDEKIVGRVFTTHSSISQSDQIT